MLYRLFVYISSILQQPFVYLFICLFCLLVDCLQSGATNKSHSSLSK